MNSLRKVTLNQIFQRTALSLLISSTLVACGSDKDPDTTPKTTPNTPAVPVVLDSDNDGVNDDVDAFPNDPNESVDTDGDGTGNNADADDDGDGFSDADEQTAGTDPLDANSKPLIVDTDNDGVADNKDAEPNNDQVVGTVENTKTNTIYKFNADGNITKLIETITNYSVTTETRTYNSNKQEVKRVIEIDNSKNGSYDEEYIYTYDANGNQNSFTRDYHRDGKIELKRTYNFDANNRLLEEKEVFNEDPQDYTKTTFTYDTNGNKIKSVAFQNRNSLYYTSIYEYNSDNQLIRKQNINGNNTSGKPYHTIEYTYSADGDITRKKETIPNYLKIEEYTYIAPSKRLEYSFSQNGTPIKHSLISYNANKQCTELVFDYYTSNTTDKYQITYDTNGRVVRVEKDQGNDGSIDVTDNFGYDTEGYMTENNNKKVIYKGTLSNLIKENYQFKHNYESCSS